MCADAAASAKDAESSSKVGAFIVADAFDGARPERAQNGCCTDKIECD